MPQSILAFDQMAHDSKSIRSADDLASLSPGLDIDRSADGNDSRIGRPQDTGQILFTST